MKDKKKGVMGIILLVLLSFSVSYFIVIAFNFPVSSPIPFLNWNPPPKENVIPILVSYPDNGTPTIGSNVTYCSVIFALDFKGDLAENTHIQVVNASGAFILNEEATFTVAFPEAIESNWTSVISSGASIIGNPYWPVTGFTNHKDNSLPTGYPIIKQIKPDYQSNFYFPVSGDYSPMIKIQILGQPEIDYTNNAIKVHVLSNAEVETEQIGKVNLGLTFTLVDLAIIGSVWLFYELVKKEEVKQSFTINISIAPENDITKPNTNNPKTMFLPVVQPNSEKNGKPIANKTETKTNSKQKNSKPSPKV
jgi:hypothetical protein